MSNKLAADSTLGPGELHSRRVPTLADVVYLADKDPQHVPGVVLAGVVLGTMLLWAAVRAMFGKGKKK